MNFTTTEIREVLINTEKVITYNGYVNVIRSNYKAKIAVPVSWKYMDRFYDNGIFKMPEGIEWVREEDFINVSENHNGVIMWYVCPVVAMVPYMRSVNDYSLMKMFPKKRKRVVICYEDREEEEDY